MCRIGMRSLERLQGSSLVCMLFAEAVVYGHSMLGFCKRLSTASLNHPPFTFYNARGLRIVKCPLRMKRTRSFVAIVFWEEQSLSVLSSVGKDSSFVAECVVCSFVVSSMVIVRSIRYTADNREFACMLHSECFRRMSLVRVLVERLGVV